MANRKDSLKRIKKLNRMTEGKSFERHYTMEGEEDGSSRLASKLWILIAVGIAVLVTAAILLWMFFGSGGEERTVEEPQIEEETDVPTAPPMPTGEPDDEEAVLEVNMPSAATFLQGPKGWKKKKDWSGAWGDKEYDGRRFAGFGCGLCVMANLYTTLTPYQCSPIDMYDFAKQSSSYEGASAIDWPHIQETMTKLGFTVDLGRKPKKYADFRRLISESLGGMVVISSYDDDSYWKHTPGHYVSILAYRASDEHIFLGDSGDLKHNRSWIPLKTVYKAIKKSNALHYMRVLGYDEELDAWKHTKISGKWVKPVYWKK
ncbi:MAG: hypothetical protein IJ807_00050 [Eubacterium sp.]|nr:hypothetical protein [Eubacterium sp.]